jgi:hypothetical protein
MDPGRSARAGRGLCCSRRVCDGQPKPDRRIRPRRPIGIGTAGYSRRSPLETEALNRQSSNSVYGGDPGFRFELALAAVLPCSHRVESQDQRLLSSPGGSRRPGEVGPTPRGRRKPGPRRMDCEFPPGRSSTMVRARSRLARIAGPKATSSSRAKPAREGTGRLHHPWAEQHAGSVLASRRGSRFRRAPK